MTSPAKTGKSVIDKCIRAALRRIPFSSEKRQNQMLEFCAGSLAEAYRLGAEEAQQEIVSRLRQIEAIETAQ